MIGHLVRFGSAVAIFMAVTGTANAVFFIEPVPEPGSAGLLIAGGVAIMAVRYLSKRKAKRDE